MKVNFKEDILPIIMIPVLSVIFLFFLLGSFHFVDLLNESKINEKCFSPSCRLWFKKLKEYVWVEKFFI